jgi:hypothetical protein
VSSFLLNKVLSFFLWRLPILALNRGVSWLLASTSVKSPRWWHGGCGFTGEALFNKRGSVFFCSKSALLLPPPAHGGSLEFDGGAAFPMQWTKTTNRWRILFRDEILFLLPSLHGGVEDWGPCSLSQSGRRRRRSRDTKKSSSTIGDRRLSATHLASRRPCFLPKLASGVLSTSRRRPSSEIVTAGGCSPLSYTDGGDRGSDCFLQISRRVYDVKSRDYSVVLRFHEVLTINVPIPLMH